MVRMRALLAALLLVGWAGAGLADDGATAAQDDLAGQALDVMTAPFLQDCLDTVRQAKAWRADYDKITQDFQNDQDADARADRLVRWAGTVDAFFQKRSPEFLKLLGWKDRVAKLKAQFDEDAQAAYQARLAALYHDDVLPLVDALQKPAQKAQDALARLIARQVFDRPYTFDNGVTLQVKGFDPKNFTTSPFSKNAGLALDIYYMKGQPGEIRAEASGLYFKPDGTPVLDKVRLKVDAKDLLTKEALGRGLVNLIASADLPVASVKNVQWVDFATGKGAARGGFRFDLALKLGEAFDFLPDLKIDNVLLRTDGKVEFGKDGVIACGPFKEPVPVGTTPFVFTNHRIRYSPGKHTGTLETDVVPDGTQEDGQKSPLRFHLTVTLDLPLTRVEVTGTAYVGDQAFGSVEGRITRDAIDVTLAVPPQGQSSPLGKVLRGTVKLHLDRKELTGKGDLTFFEGLKATADLVLQFNGNGSFAVAEGGRVGLLDVNASLGGSFRPGFKHLVLQGAMTLKVDLDWMTVDAALEVRASADGDPPVQVTTRALGQEIQFSLNSLADLNLNAVRKALNARQKQLLAGLSGLFKDGDQQLRDLAARWDEELSDSVSDFARKNHLDKVETGNPTIDRFIGQKTEEAKKEGAHIADFSHKAQKGAGKEWDNIKKGKPFGLVDDGGTAAVGKAASDIKQAMRRAMLLGKLKPLVDDLNRLVIFRSTLQGGTKDGKASELRLHLRHCIVAPEGSSGAVLAFAVEVSGFTHQLDPRKGTTGPVVKSDVQRGLIHIKNLFGKGKPVAELDLPKLRHGSVWPAEDLLWDAVSKRVKKLLPAAGEEGRFEERTLTIQNQTGERLTVWVQALTKVGSDGSPRWTWVPGAPGKNSRATRFTIEPGKTEALYLPNNGGPVRGLAARIWAKSASGRTWDQGKTIWLVEEFEDNDGRHYYASKIQPFVYRFQNPKGYDKAGEAARRKAEEAARHRAELKAEEAARRKAEEAAERRAEEAARKKAAERKAEEAARRRAEQKAEEAAARKAREAAERRAEEAARRKAEQKAQEAAERKAREAAERRAEEAARLRAEQKAREAAEEAARREAARKAEEAARRQAEEDAGIQAEQEAARRRQAEEAAARQRAQEEARRRAWEEQRRRAQEAALQRQREEAQRRAQEEAARNNWRTVPNVVGLTQAEAFRSLNAAGLRMKSMNDPRSARVSSQFPRAGTKARPGDTVTVVFPRKAR